MKLSIGIVGLPNVGKSTLFKILTKQEVHIANYPFATIDPNVGVVSVPDERLDKLAVMSASRKKIPAVVEFYDIAGLVKGANTGEGLGNQFLSHIRDCQAIVVVLRVFEDDGVIHVEKTVDPLRDLEIINTELILKDLETVEKRLLKAESDARSGGKAERELCDALRTVRDRLASGGLLTGWDSYSNVLKNIRIRELNLLTAKRQMYLLNGKSDEVPKALHARLAESGAPFIISDLSKGDPIPSLNRTAYEALELASFFTTGEDETRAWTIVRGAKAPEAAGAIHTDFEKNFIRAEVINWGKLLEAGSWTTAKQKGWLRLEGKEYVVADGDVLVIRHG